MCFDIATGEAAGSPGWRFRLIGIATKAVRMTGISVKPTTPIKRARK